MPSAVRIERVTAMHADLDLGLGLGSHAGQGTRHRSKSLLISDRRRAIDISQNTWRATQSNVVCAGELIIF
jgi:hypothetical protein